MSISIVIPAFGNQSALDHSLATLSVQRDDFAECIVVDDGSETPLTVPSWVRLHRIDREPVHRGSSAAKNLGASMSDSTYLCFCDSDILHAPDAIRSLSCAMKDWEREGEKRALINVARAGLPRGRQPESYDESLDFLRLSGDLKDECMRIPAITWEQNCGIIRHSYFNSIGGYDEASFPYWGFNNQDLCLRVAQTGGRVTSFVRRLSTGLRLFCIHIWHENGVEIAKAKAEFIAKWGEEWHDTLYGRIIQERGSDGTGDCA